MTRQQGGSVIARCGHSNDMRLYGGLKKWMPITYGTFLAATTLILFGSFNYVWIVVAGIVCFSRSRLPANSVNSNIMLGDRSVAVR